MGNVSTHEEVWALAAPPWGSCAGAVRAEMGSGWGDVNNQQRVGVDRDWGGGRGGGQIRCVGKWSCFPSASKHLSLPFYSLSHCFHQVFPFISCFCLYLLLSLPLFFCFLSFSVSLFLDSHSSSLSLSPPYISFSVHLSLLVVRFSLCLWIFESVFLLGEPDMAGRRVLSVHQS